MKKILITGCSGFIGQNFILRSEVLKDFKTCVAWNNNYPVFSKDLNLELIQLDLMNYQACLENFKNFDIVLNFAGKIMSSVIMKQNPMYGLQSNVNIHLNLFNAAKNAGLEKLIWLSSCTAYPVLGRPVKEEDYFKGQVPKRYSQVGHMFRFLEKVAEMSLSKEINLITLRPTSVYGEMDDFKTETAHILPALISEYSGTKGRKKIAFDTLELRDWIYVGDLVKAIDSSLVSLNKSATLNIGSGESISMYDLSTKILNSLNLKTKPKIEKASYPKGTSIAREVDCSASVKILGNYFQTKLSYGIDKTIEWFCSRKETLK